MKRLSWFVVVGYLFCSAAYAQNATAAQKTNSSDDATVAAAKNYKIEFENDLVRVIRVTYAPHEKSPMHSHQGNAAVIVTLKGGGRMHSINEDGSPTEGKTEQAGAVRFVSARPPYGHKSENVTDSPIEVIRVELKQPPACNQAPPK